MKSPSILINTVVVTATAFVLFCQTALAAPLKLSLDESIALTYKNNPALQIVKARQEQSVWALKEAQTNKNVSLDYTHKDLRSNSPPTWSPSPEAANKPLWSRHSIIHFYL